MDRRVVLVAGGARGIGAAAARALADEWRVVIGTRRSLDAAEALASEIADGGGEAHVLQADVARPDEAEALVARAAERCGRLDALVCAAGDFVRAPLLEQPRDAWRAVFNNNLHSVHSLARAAVPHMRRGGWGRIITFGVANGRAARAQTHVTAYYIAKVGVQILTRSLAEALGPDGITVNCISPGFIDTGVDHGPALRRVQRDIPLGRVGEVGDVVGALRFLLSDEASYVSGADLQVSGAWGV
ncbi:MAG: SDR family oxidoreductase [Myxococcales bacterium]|nr:SDR family oxidoreductase [Myxococcales bacterium]